MTEQKKTDTGSHAYPTTRTFHHGKEGMTLLDYFAGQALIELVYRSEVRPHEVAVQAYNIAAAMIAEKRKREGQDDEPA